VLRPISQRTIVSDALWAIASAVSDQVKVLCRIPEKMDPALYYKTFRPYIRFFENVFYEATEQRPIADSNPQAPAKVRMNSRGRLVPQHHVHLGNHDDLRSADKAEERSLGFLPCDRVNIGLR
jgi:hypothetical protein